MKKNWLLLVCLIISVISFSQQGNFVTNAEYSARKASGTLIGDEILLSDGMVNPNNLPNATQTIIQYSPEKATGCAGYFDPPGPAYNITWSTDDGSSPVINLPFTFCFFGDSYTSVYMNNNGNISFQNAISTFSSSAFPSTGNKMIAAFWADFDFGGCGDMYASVTPTAAIFNWVDAGYYSSECDKKNTCQIVITNGTDPLVNGGNVAIHYDDMNWTTGSASGGTNGFSGTAATVGANRGNNLDYFQLGRFDHSGTDYDGPNLLTDGVDYLDDKSFFFDFCLVTNGNISPIPTNNNTCDTLGVCHLGDTLDISFPFIAPESNQITTVSYSSPTLTNVQIISNTPGITGVLNLRIIGALETIGVHDIIVTGTDNATPPGITSVSYKIKVTDPGTAFLIEPILSFVPGCAPVTIGVNNYPYDEFNWSNNSSTDSITIISAAFNDTLSVVVTNEGCSMEIDTVINIPGTPNFNLQGNLFFCPDIMMSHLFLPDSLILDSVHWVLNSTIVSTDFSPDLGAGTYTATIWNDNSLCSKDTTFTISSQPNLVLVADQSTCIPTYQFVGNIGGVGTGTWSVLGSPNPSPTFSNNNLNPLVTFNGFGTFSLIYTENGCLDKDTVNVTWNPSPVVAPITGNLNICIGTTSLLADATPSGTWSSGSLSKATIDAISGLVTGISVGTSLITYSVTELGCTSTQTATVNITAPPVVASITGITNVCVGSTTQLADATIGGVWSSASPAIATVSASGLVSGVSLGNCVISYTVSLNGCSTPQTTTINVIDILTPITGDTILCVNDVEPLANSTVGGTWSSSDLTKVTVSASGVITGVSAGSATITYTFCSIAITTTVTVNPSPIVPAITGVNSICNGSSTTFSNLNTGGTWTSGTPSVATIDIATGVINALSVGSSLITYTVTSLNGCSTSQTKTINVSIFAPVDLNYPADSASTCNAVFPMTTNIGGSNNGTNGTWTATPIGGTGSVTFGNNNNINTTLTFSDFGLYRLVYTDDVCLDDDTVFMIYSDKPYFELGNDFFYCPAEAGLHLEIPDSTSMNSISWGISGPQNTLFSATLLGSTGAGTSYSVHLVNQFNCFNDTTFFVKTQTPIYIDTFLFDLSNHGVCAWDLDSTYKMYLNLGVEPGTWSYTGPAGATVTFDDNTILNPKVKFSNYGTYYLRYTEPTCNDDDTLMIRILPAESYVDIGDAYHKLCSGNALVLTTNALNKEFIDSWVWSTGATTENIIVNEAGWYKLTISSECPYPYTDSTYIEVKICDIEMPNVFSPNGDGINDVYHIKGDTEIFKEFNIVIVNRWGNLIKEYSDPLGTWDGTNNSGSKVNPGVYFYSVKAVTLQDQPLVKEGFIEVIIE